MKQLCTCTCVFYIQYMWNTQPKTNLRVWMKYLCAEFYIPLCLQQLHSACSKLRKILRELLMGRSVPYTIIFNKYFRFPIPEVPRHSSSKRQAAKTIKCRLHFIGNVSWHTVMDMRKGHEERIYKNWCCNKFLIIN